MSITAALADANQQQHAELARLRAREVALVAEVAVLTAERDALRVPEQRGTT